MINPRKGTWFCYGGCSKGGDVLDFVQEYLRLDFIEAVEYLAKEVGERVEFDQNREASKQEYKAAKDARDWHFNLMNEVNQFYYTEAWRDVIGWKLDKIEVDGRRYSVETLYPFQVSYAPTNALLNAAGKGRFNLEDLVKANLVKKAEKGGQYDHFSNRTLFPLHDPEGRVVGFTGRRQPDGSAKSAKYKNSDESPVFQKSKYLYGLFQGGREIIRQEVAYVVEGQHDLLTMHEFGIKNVVATSGTALTVHHARLLGRYADRVVLLFDGDEAGVKAAGRAVENLAAGLDVKVCILAHPTQPETKIDPCEYIRQFGVEAFQEFLQSHTEDGIVWAIMQVWHKEDTHRQQQAFQVAARLLAQLTQIKRDIYVQQLTSKNRMGAVKKLLEESVNSYLAENAPAKAFSPEQQDQIAKYGVYVSGRQYFTPWKDGEGVPISNFIIRSMLLIDGNASSERVLEIENVKGFKVVTRIRSEIFTDLGAFRAWVEARGHFSLKVKAETWNAIRDLVYDSMITAYPITVLGLHREGFYTFKNGIFDGDTFQPASASGVVQNGPDHFLITASANFDNIKADDGNANTVHSRFMTYQNVTHQYTFLEWGTMMRKAYGDKAIAGMAYYLASLFRDIIFERFTFFPHFNVFGVKGSGKNYFIESLMSTLGRVDAPPDLTNMTSRALNRVLSGIRNGMVWLDEYKNEIDPGIISALRGAYGASGRTTAEQSMDNQTRRFDPKSGLIISGEHRPTKDIALYSRMCAVETISARFSLDEIQFVEKLREIEQSGAFIPMTLQLLKYRAKVQQQFYTKFAEIRAAIQQITEGAETRILTNWCIIAAVGEVLREAGEVMPWKMTEITDFIVERIAYQSRVVMSEDHLANFWRILAYLIEDNKIQHNYDVIVQSLKRVRLQNPRWRRNGNEPEYIDYEPQKPEMFLFLRMAKVHPLYLQHFAMQNRNGVGLQIGTIEHYITTSPNFIGRAKKKFKEGTLACLVVRLDSGIPIELLQSRNVEGNDAFSGDDSASAGEIGAVPNFD